MFILENELLRVEINARGAELQSLKNKVTGLEYLWNGDPAFWAKRSPVLFPIVGSLKEDTYYFQGKAFHLPRHGFARDMDFVPEKQSQKEITLGLTSNPETKKNYPFDFQFRIRYQLLGDELSTEYMVTNNGTGLLYFSVGGHPAFRLPMDANTEFSDYYLEFDETENLQRWPISKEGLIQRQPVPFLKDSKRLDLKKSLFYQDALVFKYPASSEISLLSKKTAHGLLFQMGEFPFLGIWSFKDADFLCLEPWCGIADSVDSNQQLEGKEGIEKLASGKVFSRQWRVKLF
jgi:galactose mutarotase-like enzyme